MVLVAVGDVDPAQLGLVLDHVGVVGKDVVDAVHLLGGEGEAAIQDDQIVVGLDGPHVLADLAEPAEWEDADVRMSQIKPPRAP
ncbi:hypothetical protein D3C72_2284080 [compost metagenome]